MAEECRMNSPKGKELLSLIRSADYAHAGETESIDMVFKDIKPDPNRKLLDIGCGRGGTAYYLQMNEYGKVSGFDNDTDTIEAARKKYPQLTLEVAPAETCAEVMQDTYDILYAFNVFYALRNKREVYKNLYKLANPKAQLLIFDYTAPDTEIDPNEYRAHWRPLEYNSTVKTAQDAGWRLVDFKDWSEHYLRWYTALVQKIESKKSQIIEKSSEGWYDFIHFNYAEQRDELANGVLGGGFYHFIKAGQQ